MILGAQSNAPFSPEDLGLIRGTFNGMKLMVGNNVLDAEGRPDPARWVHRPEDLAALRAVGVRHFLIRLPDSGRPDGRRPLFSEYVAECVPVMEAFFAAGEREFQLDCEPNEQAAWQGAGAEWVYQAFLRDVIRELRSLCPWARIGLAPLSYSPKWFGGPLDQWKRAFSEALYEKGVKVAPPLCSLFDFACANCYWQSPEKITDLGYGAGFREVRSWSGLPVVITEWGNSLCDKKPVPPPIEEIRTAMCREYPQWLHQVRQYDYV
ncbi:MAG TPA: hypothetical protein VEX13_08725, partial [Chloroflexia bacterium]|nr:hypothetical protein [Chloroflexia bacterium]